METVMKTRNNIKNMLQKNAANQDANEQLSYLYHEKNKIIEQLTSFNNEPIRRPSQQHKNLKNKLNMIEKEIKTTKKAIKKYQAIKTIAKKLGRNHGNIILNKTKYFW